MEIMLRQRSLLFPIVTTLLLMVYAEYTALDHTHLITETSHNHAIHIPQPCTRYFPEQYRIIHVWQGAMIAASPTIKVPEM